MSQATKKLRGVAIVAHGGGPTPVINASLAGLVSEARNHVEITAVWGALFGANGLVDGQFRNLTELGTGELEAMARAPGSVLGSSRRKFESADYEKILDVFGRDSVRFLFYTGGNGSMGTALRMDALAREAGWEMRVIGVPKTIDNDISGTDHTPGYASCARFFAHVVRDVGADNRALPPPIEVIEVLGRNVGWVVAATALARKYEDDPPHLIYLPEQGISADQLCTDVERVYRRIGRCLVAICEGQTDERGGWFGAELGTLPGARDPLPANMGHVLAKLIWAKTGIRARAEKPGLFGRSCAVLASEVDREESWRCGEAAVRAAVEGQSGVMVAMERVPGEFYRSEMVTVPLEKVAGTERQFPREWIGAQGNDVSPDFVRWVRPIVGEVSSHFRL